MEEAEVSFQFAQSSCDSGWRKFGNKEICWSGNPFYSMILADEPAIYLRQEQDMLGVNILVFYFERLTLP